MPTFREKMLKRGWTEGEVKKTLEMMRSPEKVEKHLPIKKELQAMLYWSVLLVLVICNFVVSIVLIPFLLVLTSVELNLITLVLGLIFGLFFNLIIRDIEHLEKKHHLVAAIFIPVIAALNIFVMVSVAQRLAVITKVGVTQNPIPISIIYVAAFLLPYLITTIRGALKKK